METGTSATPIKRRLTAILAADAVGYSRQMSENEEATLQVLAGQRAIIDRLIIAHEGRIFSTAGDSVLAEFASSVEAVRCAVEIQEALQTRNENAPESQRLEFRIGVNLGDVMVDGADILGDGVNVAARLESIAEPGGICISSSVYDQIMGKLSLGFVDLGEKLLKNIARPIRVYRFDRSGEKSGADRHAPTRKLWLGIGGAVLLVVFAAGAWQAGLFKRRAAPVSPPPSLLAERAPSVHLPGVVSEETKLKLRIAEAERAKAEAELARSRTDAELAKQRAAALRGERKDAVTSPMMRMAGPGSMLPPRVTTAEPPKSAGTTSTPSTTTTRTVTTPAPKAVSPITAPAEKPASSSTAEATKSPATSQTPTSTTTGSVAIPEPKAASPITTPAEKPAPMPTTPAAVGSTAKPQPNAPLLTDSDRGVALRSCEAYEDLRAFSDAIPVRVLNGEMVVEQGIPGKPGYVLISGRPSPDGHLVLSGMGISVAIRWRGKQFRARYEGTYREGRYELNGFHGDRRCTMTIQMDRRP